MRVATWSASALLALLLLAGLIPAATPVSAVARTSQADPLAALLAQNRRSTVNEAVTLLHRAVLPPQAVALAPGAPGAISSPFQIPQVGSLIDLHSDWTVAAPFIAVSRYTQAHPSVAAKWIGTSSGSGSAGFVYYVADNPAWQDAQLQIALRPLDARTTVLRVDGMAAYVDPHPIRVSPAQRPVFALTKTGTCKPAMTTSVYSEPDVGNRGTDLDRQLLPTQPPTDVVICRYLSSQPKPPRLVLDRLLSAKQAQSLAVKARNIDLGSVRGGVIVCPADLGVADYASFGYRGRPRVTLILLASGCPSVNNGHIQATGSGLYKFLAAVPAS